MTLIYDMSMFCKIQRVIRMKLSRYDHGIMASVVTAEVYEKVCLDELQIYHNC